MSLPAESRSKIRFGDFEVDLRTAEVRQNGHKFVLQGQPFQVLVILLERPGELVTREELKKRLWSSDTFVDFDHSLNKAVNRLRETLSDSADNPRYIETLPRRGYRFVAEIAPDERPETAVSSLLSPAQETIGTAAAIRVIEDAKAGSRESEGRLTRIWLYAALVAVALMIAVAGSLLWQHKHEIPSPNIENLEVTRLTNNGTVSNVAISPDGRYVAYVENHDEKTELRLRQVATGSDTQILPPDGGWFVGITFSPDGNYIYFVRSDKSDISFRYLYSVPSLGGAPRKLIADVDSNITFSPDGRELAYELWNPPSNSMKLKIANADGTGERVLAVIHDTSFFSAGGPGPSWSPDGRTIVFPKQMIKGPYRSVLFTVSVSDGGVHQLYTGSEELGRVVWHPSGDHLLLQKFDLHSRRAQLWTVSFPEGVMRRLTHDAAEYWQDLDSTRDGKTLVAIAAASRTQVWASNGPNFTVAEPITATDPPMDSVKVNKHGKLFAKDLAGYLWTMNPDGTALTKFEGVHDVDVIEPCGDFIVYSSSNDNSDVLMRVDADGTHPTKLVGGKLFSPSCASDGKFVYYVSSTFPQVIWRVGISGGNPEKVAQVLGDCIIGAATIFSDGRFLAYPYSTYYTASLGDHYAVIKASDGTLLKSFDMAREKFDNGPYWSSDGKYLQFVVTRSGMSNLWQHPFEGGPPRQLTHFTSDEIFDFSWAPDGSRLFLTRGKVSSDVVLLTGLH